VETSIVEVSDSYIVELPVMKTVSILLLFYLFSRFQKPDTSFSCHPFYPAGDFHILICVKSITLMMYALK